MSLLLTFGDTKAAIIANIKQFEICSAFQNVVIASDYDSLLDAAFVEIPEFDNPLVWGYLQNIVPDEIMTSFPESNLNSKGIYSTGIFSLTNPSTDIYIISNPGVTINVNGNNHCNIYLMGAGSLTLNLSGNAFVELKAYNTSQATINLADNSVLKLTTSQTSTNTITANNTAIFHAQITDASILNYTGNDTAYALIRAYNQSTVNITAVSDQANLQIVPHAGSTINNPTA